MVTETQAVIPMAKTAENTVGKHSSGQKPEASPVENIGDVFLGIANDGLESYLKKVKQFPLLTAEEEIVLAKKVEEGDIKARDRFIMSNQLLVVSIANGFFPNHMTTLELIQEGNFGLIHAVNTFNWRKGCKFSTYAHWWIRKAILSARQEQDDTIRVSQSVHGSFSKMRKAEKKLLLSGIDEPTPEELAKEMDISAEEAVDLKRWSQLTISLDALIEDEKGAKDFGALEEDRTSSIGIDPFEQVARKLEGEEVHCALDCLDNSNRRKTMELKYGIGGYVEHNNAEVGRKLGVSRERVRQIEKKAEEDLIRIFGKLRELSLEEKAS